MGVLEAGGDFDFLEEPFSPDHRGHVRAEDLDRNLPMVFEIEGLIDGGHPTLTQDGGPAVGRPIDLVTFGQDSGPASQVIRHAISRLGRRSLRGLEPARTGK